MKSAPKDTSRHPWRKSNSSLKNYSRKAMAEKKKQNIEVMINEQEPERSVARKAQSGNKS